MACSDSDYRYLREVVQTQSANLIDPSRNALFDTRLTPMARLAGAASLKDFVGILRDDTRPQLHRAVAEAMTINETSFFRDGQPFELIRETILPQLIARGAHARRLRIWSAGSSTGQEAYSIAMLICEHFPELLDWDVKIIGTDLSRTVVASARAGRYRRLEVNRGLPVRMLLKYFEKLGEEWEVVPKVRRMCEFHHANLCAPMPEARLFDVVLLRNVLLYFGQADRSRLFAEVHRQMNPEGFLMLGNAEQAEDSTRLFEVEFAAGGYVYRPAKAG